MTESTPESATSLPHSGPWGRSVQLLDPATGSGWSIQERRAWGVVTDQTSADQTSADQTSADQADAASGPSNAAARRLHPNLPDNLRLSPEALPTLSDPPESRPWRRPAVELTLSAGPAARSLTLDSEACTELSATVQRLSERLSHVQSGVLTEIPFFEDEAPQTPHFFSAKLGQLQVTVSAQGLELCLDEVRVTTELEAFARQLRFSDDRLVAEDARWQAKTSELRRWNASRRLLNFVWDSGRIKSAAGAVNREQVAALHLNYLSQASWAPESGLSGSVHVETYTELLYVRRGEQGSWIPTEEVPLEVLRQLEPLLLAHWDQLRQVGAALSITPT